MVVNQVTRFKEDRNELNEVVMQYVGRDIKRFYNLDAQVYREGALSAQTKELLGLVASMVLRCDDCINYHLVQCYEAGVTTEELEEAIAIALIVGGSIVIPHLRRAFKFWDTLVTKGGT